MFLLLVVLILIIIIDDFELEGNVVFFWLLFVFLVDFGVGLFVLWLLEGFVCILFLISLFFLLVVVLLLIIVNDDFVLYEDIVVFFLLVFFVFKDFVRVFV